MTPPVVLELEQVSGRPALLPGDVVVEFKGDRSPVAMS
jgi:hypothetical protein